VVDDGVAGAAVVVLGWLDVVVGGAEVAVELGVDVGVVDAVADGPGPGSGVPLLLVDGADGSVCEVAPLFDDAHSGSSCLDNSVNCLRAPSRVSAGNPA
jgi:hypothetical protein